MHYEKGIVYHDAKKPDPVEMVKKAASSSATVEKKKDKPKTEHKSGGMNFDFFKNDVRLPSNGDTSQISTTTQKSKSKRVNTNEIVKADTKSKKQEENYADKYTETDAILKSAIVQIDVGLAEMQQDITQIRSSKTLRNKYQQLSNIQSAMGAYISNKISAARELNNTITKCNELELRRAKEMKAANDQDSDKKIMDMYNAFIHTPIGGQPGMQYSMPSMQDLTFMEGISGANIDPGTVDDIGYQNYLQSKSPAENMVLLSQDPNIKQVVMYDKSTGSRWFEVVDMRTGQPVPNTEKYDMMFMEHTTLDLNNMVATNTNIGESFPIIVVGDSPVINEY